MAAELLLPEQLQMLLENPQDGDVPTMVYSQVADTVKTAMAWELEHCQAVEFLDSKQAIKGPQWPPKMDPEVAALAHYLDTLDDKPSQEEMFVRRLDPVKGLVTDFWSHRLTEKGLAHDKKTTQWLILSKTTHPLTEDGLAQKAALQTTLLSALAELQKGPVDVSTRDARTWMGAWFLDTFLLLQRALNGPAKAGRTAHLDGVRSLVSGGLISLELARVAYRIADAVEKPLDLLFGALDFALLDDDRVDLTPTPVERRKDTPI